MINYTKVRESVQKNPSKKSLGRSINKSHTSSINIKLSQEGPVEQVKIPLKNIFKDKAESTTKGHQQSQHKKYSMKLPSNQKENQARRRQTGPYDVTIFRPFQDTNRYMETERFFKDYKPHQERTPIKQTLKLRNQHIDHKHIRTDYTDTTPEKYRKQTSTKHTTENSNKIIKVPTEDLKKLMDELIKQKAEVADLKRQLQFFRAHASQGNRNPVMRALRV